MSRGPMGEEKPGGKCNETMKFPRRPLPSGENCAMLYPYVCRQIPAGLLFLDRCLFFAPLSLPKPGAAGGHPVREGKLNLEIS